MFTLTARYWVGLVALLLGFYADFNQAKAQSLVLGVEAEEVTVARRPRLRISTVRPETVAQAAGLRPGDFILAVDSVPLRTIEELAAAIRKKQPGDTLSIEVDRRGDRIQLKAQFPKTDPAPIESPADNADSDETPKVTLETPVPGSGRLGVTVENAETTPPAEGVPVSRGAVVVAVAEKSPAETLGLKAGDVIVAVNGKILVEAADLITQISETKPGQSVELSFYQGRQFKRESVVLADESGIAMAPAGLPRTLGTPRSSGPPAANPAAAKPSGILGGIGGAIGGLFGRNNDAAETESADSTMATEALEEINPGIPSTIPPGLQPGDALQPIPATPIPVPDLQPRELQPRALPTQTTQPSTQSSQQPAAETTTKIDGNEAVIAQLQAQIRALQTRLEVLEKRLVELELHQRPVDQSDETIR